MSNNWFRFKQFTIEQGDCSMKVGTDGVLLGAWFPIERGMKVLDIGTGTGIVTLMAAQRGADSVTAVEIDRDTSEQARRNADASPWKDRIDVVHVDIADFISELRFDRIVCNPPYFRDSLRSPDRGRNMARHNDSLSFEVLSARASTLLSDDGLFCLVLPSDAVEAFTKCAAAVGLGICRRTDVVTVPGKAPKRSLVAFSKSGGVYETAVLQMYDSDGKETAEYLELVRNFYLKY